MSQVIILQQGYGFTDQKNVYHASATCTLVVMENMKIIVDPAGAWQREEIIKSLQDHSVDVSDINVVVGTHGHSDHVGNLNLFPGAKQIIGFDVNVGDCYEENQLGHGGEYVLLKDQVVVIPTPGHMHHDVSVVVYNVESLGTVGIVGDLFERENDEDEWRSISESPELQEKNRKKVLELCDFIVPGHGPMFKNKLKGLVK